MRMAEGHPSTSAGGRAPSPPRPVGLKKNVAYLLHGCIRERPPNFQFYLFIVIEELADTLYLKHQTEVILILVLLPLLAVAEATVKF